jgi:glycosyltransferase involved in cell wall biosynthesis
MHKLLIDAVYINNGGGKILLDALIRELVKGGLNVTFLLDDRIRGNHPKINSEALIYIRAGVVSRTKFYYRNQALFSKILCFANIPPFLKVDAEVLTYFHQPMYLNVPREFDYLQRAKFILKALILKTMAKHTDLWLVQSDHIKARLIRKFKLNVENAEVLPFYPLFDLPDRRIERKDDTFLYVSSGAAHKNHFRLVNAFCGFYDKYKRGKLILTIESDSPSVLELIREKVSVGYPIVNIGFVDRATLQNVYMSSKFLVYPSLAESFGLGLIEAIECGCFVIGADLPYTYEVCQPTLIFNPLEVESIFKAFEDSLQKDNLIPSRPIITNEIGRLIKLLQE